MPKKSDRNSHESAMESLLPEVSLEDDPEEGAEQSSSSTELQKSRSTEENNSSTNQEPPEEPSQSPSKTNADETKPAPHSSEASTSSPTPSNNKQAQTADRYLEVLPPDRPSLKQKLGPYVSREVDEALEEVYLLLRRQLGGKASKSLIVEAALRYTLNDFLQRGENSEVAKWLKMVLDE